MQSPSYPMNLTPEPLPRSEPATPKIVKTAMFFGTQYSLGRCSHTFRTMEATMLKGGLLWLIGIPLPIILILFFMGWLS